jgi:peroxiredoxin
MALTESTMMALGQQAPDFSLPSTDGINVGLNDFADKDALVVLFICNHCPYVIHIAPALAKLADEYLARNVGFVAISSNDVEHYPADSFELMKEEKAKQGYNFPYLYDEDQAVAKAYGAACTPDLYVFDKSGALAYRGQFDDSRPTRISSGNYNSDDHPSDGASLRAALDTLLSGGKLPEKQYPSMGCNIKWKAGNEPSYF